MKNLTGADLLRAYLAAKQDDSSLTLDEFAAGLGLERDIVKNRLQRARAKYGHQGERLDQSPEPGQAAAEPPGPLGDQVKVDQDNNTLSLESGFGQRITTLEALLEYAQVDLEAWAVERWVINKWEVGAKGPDGALTVAPLIQVKAWLVRIEPVEIKPVIKPVTLTVRALAQPAVMKPGALQALGLRAALIIPDLQIGYNRQLATGRLDPFHDRTALDVALQVAAFNHFDDLVYLGDILDLPDWSDKFTRSPEFYFNTQSAIIEAAWWLAQFRAVQPDARMALIEGNHERRMREAINNHLAASYQIKPANDLASLPAMSLPRLLALDDIGAEWIGDYPRAKLWLNPGVAAIHGVTVRGVPGETAKAVAANSAHSVIFGHIHRREVASRTHESHSGSQVITAMSPGCLCRLDWVVPGHEPGQNWQQGLGVVYYDPDSYYHTYEIIPIERGQAVWAGQVYRGVDRLAELATDSGWAPFSV